MARRCGAPFVRRRGSLAQVFAEHASRCAYVVGRNRDELLCGEQRLAVHQGMLPIKSTLGRAHPFMRALAPQDRPPPSLVVDATLGLAGDALHMAGVLGCQVLGFELSPVVFSLVEEGLPRLVRGGVEAAARVQCRHADALEALADLGPAAADVVFVNPMFDRPRKAAPGFHLLREVASVGALDPGWVDLALAASPRIVFRVPRGQQPPAELAERGPALVQGKAVDYLVLQR